MASALFFVFWLLLPGWAVADEALVAFLAAAYTDPVQALQLTAIFSVYSLQLVNHCIEGFNPFWDFSEMLPDLPEPLAFLQSNNVDVKRWMGLPHSGNGLEEQLPSMQMADVGRWMDLIWSENEQQQAQKGGEHLHTFPHGAGPLRRNPQWHGLLSMTVPMKTPVKDWTSLGPIGGPKVPANRKRVESKNM
ncbi:hypothetical protein B0H10DRAFT_1940891 [Mycena sp. CBHHK59/15]|nr:hypothetical protein B0H10DRAFT_1940891 [Mycena sp. CBHHK59/15]